VLKGEGSERIMEVATKSNLLTRERESLSGWIKEAARKKARRALKQSWRPEGQEKAFKKTEGTCLDVRAQKLKEKPDVVGKKKGGISRLSGRPERVEKKRIGGQESRDLMLWNGRGGGFIIGCKGRGKPVKGNTKGGRKIPHSASPKTKESDSGLQINGTHYHSHLTLERGGNRDNVFLRGVRPDPPEKEFSVSRGQREVSKGVLTSRPNKVFIPKRGNCCVGIWRQIGFRGLLNSSHEKGWFL